MRRVFSLLVFASVTALLSAPAVAALPGGNTQVNRDWNDLFMQVFYVALAVFVLVVVLIVYILIRFRARKGGPTEGPHIHGNTKMEVAWSIAPTAVMAWLLVVSYQGLFIVDALPENPDVTVNVTGSQFSWTFEYPDRSTSVGTLRVEEGRTVLLNVTSTDVIHAFSIFDLGVMIDAIPGRTTHDSFEALVPGTYVSQCRELCGKGHSRMLATVEIFPAGSQGLRHYGAVPAEVPPEDTTAPPANETQGRPIPVALGPGFVIVPPEVKVEKGEAVTFQVSNPDIRVHDFYVGNYSDGATNNGAAWFTEPLAPGESATLTFHYDADQTFTMWCNQGGHYQGGMKGDVVVGSGGGKREAAKPLLPGFEPFLLVGALALVVLLLRRR